LPQLASTEDASVAAWRYDQEAIKVLPKRRMALEMQDGKREYFWGLLVRERRSSTILFAYIYLFNLLSVIFFFLWLFY
jgi:hypothetical protein